MAGTPIESWTSKLSRPPGTAFFPSTGNIAFLLICGLLLALLVRSRRYRAASSARAARLALLGATALWALSLCLFWEAGGSRGLAERGYVLCYEASLAALVTGALLLFPRPAPRPRRPELWALLSIALLTMVFRLASNPPFIHAEEVAMGLWSRYCTEGRLPELFATGYFDNPVLHFAIDGLLMRFVGTGIGGLRLTSVPVGLLTVFLSYRLAEELLPGRMAPLLAAAATSFHHAFLYYSRNGLHIIDATLAVTATSLLTVRSLKAAGVGTDGRAASGLGLLAGVVAGVVVQGYFPTRLAPVVALGLFAWSLLFPGGLRRAQVSRTMLAFLLGLLIALGPLALHFLTRPQTLSSREEKVLAFDPADLLRGDAAARASLARSLGRTLRLHTLGADDDPHYGGFKPFLHPLCLPLILSGLVALTFRPRSLAARLCLVWMAAALLLGSVIVKEPRIRRTLALVPAAGLLVAAGATAIAGSGRMRRPVLGGAAALVLASSVDQVDYVLRRFPMSKPADLPSAAARYLAEHPDDPVTLLTLPDLRGDDRHLDLLAPARGQWRCVARGADIVPGTVIVSALHAPLYRALARLPGAAIAFPWGRSPLWDRTYAPPDQDETRDAPPLRLLLTGRPPSVARVTLLRQGGETHDAFESPLPSYDFVRVEAPWVATVRIETVLDGGAGGGLRALPLSRHARATLTIDGDPSSPGVEVAVAPGPHAVAATFSELAKEDGLMLVVEVAGSATCCRAP